jgi:hypothetical protein
MTATINVNSYSYLLRLGLLGRMKLVPPFSGCARFATTPAKIIQPEHLPYLGVYFLRDSLSDDGDANVAEPKFVNRLHIGCSYIIQNNDDELCAENVDTAYWSFMKLLHDPAWHLFEQPSGDVVRIESISDIVRDENLKGTLQNGTPIGELTIEVTYLYRIQFDPIVTDLFEIFHMRTIYPWPEDPGRKPIITEWVLETPPVPILTLLSYDYQKPTDPAVPVAGAITHPDEASDTMRLAKMSQGGQDNSALLATVRPGDRLSLGAITWTVMGVADEPTSIHITVTPITQSAASGVQQFTLATGVSP